MWSTKLGCSCRHPVVDRFQRAYVPSVVKHFLSGTTSVATQQLLLSRILQEAKSCFRERRGNWIRTKGRTVLNQLTHVANRVSHDRPPKAHVFGSLVRPAAYVRYFRQKR